MQPDDVTVQLADGRKMILRPAEEIPPSFYINNASFGMTKWDIKIELSEIQGFVPGDDPEVPVALISKKARLVMTAEYAKVFASALLRQISMHEDAEKREQSGPEAHHADDLAEPEKTVRRIRMKSNRK